MERGYIDVGRERREREIKNVSKVREKRAMLMGMKREKEGDRGR